MLHAVRHIATSISTTLEGRDSGPADSFFFFGIGSASFIDPFLTGFLQNVATLQQRPSTSPCHAAWQPPLLAATLSNPAVWTYPRRPQHTSPHAKGGKSRPYPNHDRALGGSTILPAPNGDSPCPRDGGLAYHFQPWANLHVSYDFAHPVCYLDFVVTHPTCRRGNVWLPATVVGSTACCQGRHPWEKLAAMPYRCEGP